LLAEGVVHVWRVSLETVGEELLVTALAPDEHRRGEGIVDPRRGLSWKRSRAALRELLARYTGGPPAEVSIVNRGAGKPALARAHVTAPASPGAEAQLHFNLSHSRGVALYAFALAEEVGIDIECLRPGRERELLDAWTRREASVKCRGTSVFSPAAQPAAEPPWVAALPGGHHEVAALAVSRRPRAVCRFQWRPCPAEGRSEDPDADRLGEGLAFGDGRQHHVRRVALS
jgi:phosphopantetheinyl transferase